MGASGEEAGSEEGAATEGWAAEVSGEGVESGEEAWRVRRWR